MRGTDCGRTTPRRQVCNPRAPPARGAPQGVANPGRDHLQHRRPNIPRLAQALLRLIELLTGFEKSSDSRDALSRILIRGVD